MEEFGRLQTFQKIFKLVMKKIFFFLVFKIYPCVIFIFIVTCLPNFDFVLVSENFVIIIAYKLDWWEDLPLLTKVTLEIRERKEEGMAHY